VVIVYEPTKDEWDADFKKSKKQLGIFNMDTLRHKSIIYINRIPMEFPGFIQ